MRVGASRNHCAYHLHFESKSSTSFPSLQNGSIYLNLLCMGNSYGRNTGPARCQFSPSRGSDNCGGPALIRGFNSSSSSEPFMPRRWRCFSSIKGPESPTSQLLPISRSTSCSGTGKERQRRWWRIEKLQKIVSKNCM